MMMTFLGQTLPKWRMVQVLSFMLASVLSMILMVHPVYLMGEVVNHGALTLLCIGISGCFVNGVGFYPQSSLWQIVFHPVVAWVLISYGVYAI